jgi:hypothetical protein
LYNIKNILLYSFFYIIQENGVIVNPLLLYFKHLQKLEGPKTAPSNFVLFILW